MSVLGHPEIGNPKRMTYIPTISPQRTCLIGRCKDMMSKMDPMRAREWQDEVAGTFLVTHKFSSSIFCWKGIHKLQEGESKNTKDKPLLLNNWCFWQGPLSPLFIATRDTTGGKPMMLQLQHSRMHSWTHSRVQYCRFSIQ